MFEAFEVPLDLFYLIKWQIYRKMMLVQEGCGIIND